MKRQPTIAQVSVEDVPSILDALATSFERSLQARDLSKHTLLAYMTAIREFVRFLRAYRMPLDPANISREYVELYMSYLGTTPVPKTGEYPRSKTLSLKYRVLKVFFGWLVDMDEIQRSPMERMTPPRVIQAQRPVLTDEQVKAVLRTCEGKGF
jgi:site-specific recombinase XerD